MRNPTPDRPSLPYHLAAPHQPPLASAPFRHALLTHRLARRSLARLLDAAIEPELAVWLLPHVGKCACCHSALEALRQAETWLRKQPVVLLPMVAAQGAAWAIIQARIAEVESGAWEIHSPRAIQGIVRVPASPAIPLSARRTRIGLNVSARCQGKPWRSKQWWKHFRN